MKITNLVKTYKIKKGNSVRAVDNISFDLPDSGMVFLLGKSGSGKTTLLNLLGGLDFADSGDIVYEDKSLKNFSAKELDSYRNTYCGFVFQDYNLLPEFTVKENIALSLQIQGKSPTDEEISVALKEVDLEGYENRKITELSGGQKQRIAIVRALIKNPKILFADEPTGALDSATGDDILNILKKLSKDKLVIVVSHDREYAQKYADRIIELKDGKIISDTDTNFIQCKNESTYKSIKSGMPLKAALRIGISNFRLHPFKFILTLIISVIAFSLFGVAFTMRTSNEDSILTNSLIDNNIDYVTYERLYLKNEGKTVAKSRDSDIALLSQETGLTYSPIRFDDYEIESFFDLSALENAYYAIMPSGATYFSLSQAENFGFSIIGSLPKSDNEVALTYFTASLFIRSGLAENDNVTIIDNERDLINKQITINGSIFTVVGIIDTKLDSSRYEVLKDTPMNFESTLINEYKSILCYSMHNVLIFNQSCFNAQSDSILLTQDFYIPTISVHYKPKIVLKAENANVQKSFINDIDISKQYILLSSYNIYLALKDISCQLIYNQETYYSFGNLFNAYKEDYINSILNQEYQIAIDNGYIGSKEQYRNYLITYKYNQYGKNYEQLILQAFEQFNIEFEISSDIEIEINMSKFNQQLSVFLGGFFASNTNDEMILVDDTSYETISNYYGGVFDIAIAPFDFAENSAKDLLLIKADESFGFGFTNYVFTSLEEFRPNLEKIIKIFGIIALVLAAFSIGLFVYFISTSIFDKSYTIGILRVLGCKAFDVITIFIIESLLLGILTIIFSELGTFIICTAINGFLLAKTGLLITILKANIFVFLSIFGIIITIAVLSGIFSTAKLIKSMPLDFLKN